MGGTEVQLHKIQSFDECITTCELQEERSSGPYYTWTKKTIGTRIDRAFMNDYWFNPFDVKYFTWQTLSHAILHW